MTRLLQKQSTKYVHKVLSKLTQTC